jgi:hypothetical protein
MKLFHYLLLRCHNVKCFNEILHYSVLTAIHMLYSYAYTEKRHEVKYIGYFSFAYIITINFIGVKNINKTEATIAEIVFFAVLLKVA